MTGDGHLALSDGMDELTVAAYLVLENPAIPPERLQ
jgi:hypothetical protein